MKTEVEKSLLRITANCLQHCSQYRLIDYPIDGVEMSTLIELGNELVNLFERRATEWTEGARQKVGAPGEGEGSPPKATALLQRGNASGGRSSGAGMASQSLNLPSPS